MEVFIDQDCSMKVTMFYKVSSENFNCIFVFKMLRHDPPVHHRPEPQETPQELQLNGGWYLQMLLIFRKIESDNLQEGPAEPPWKKMMDYTQAPQVNLLQLRLVSLEKLTN